jgi:type I restriction enzyme S subunit
MNLLIFNVLSWEQRKLSDITNVYDGVHQTPDYQESGIMFLSVENIATLKSNKYISQEAFERDYKNYPEKGDILMTRIGDVGTPNVVETTEKVAFYVSLALLKPKNVDSYFLCNAICSPEFQRDLKNRTLVTAIPQKINKDEIGKVEFLMPQNTAEQKAIGAYFKNLDHLITLHQSKAESWKNKKNQLSTISWEQRKLGTLSQRVIVGLATSVTQYYRDAGVPILRNLNIKENRLDDEDILYLDEDYAKSQISKQIHTGDVLTVHTGYIGTSCVVPEKYDNCLTFTTLVTTTDSSKLKGEFLAQYLNSESGMSAVQTVTTQGGRQNLNTNDFVKVEIPYPSIPEQEKICEALINLDTLITLHHRKLNRTQICINRSFLYGSF